MQPSNRMGLAVVVAAGALLEVWSAFGPFLVSPGPYHWSVTPATMSFNLGFGLLWVAVLGITFAREPGGRMWKLILLNMAADGA